ncbi:hypothetical protein M5D96_006300, partial [Drosophila gunungcola]
RSVGDKPAKLRVDRAAVSVSVCCSFCISVSETALLQSQSLPLP